MLELPEAAALARQISETVAGKTISQVTAAYTPHKFTWYHGDPQSYHALLTGKTIKTASNYGGLVEISAGEVNLLLGDGVNLRFHVIDEPRPKKHQLLLEFEDGTALSASVQMYGGICCFNDGDYDNSYYTIARKKPSPLSDEFNRPYFDELISLPELQKLSAKAFLATEQRIPGLGNGVLQDILWQAKIHPKSKLNSLTAAKIEQLFNSVKSVLSEMTEQGGRDTEKDLFGKQGGYKTAMSKNSAGKPCALCGGTIKKENYMGGSIYYCEQCQVM